ncbi:MAG TPA: RNA methyltransferase [Bacilli bacterium]|nr:RNA methyltransferase [Bacilli bacterium]HPX83321.1 RNA methyltransferase [Bacilli bacterium]HQQ38993.1 RNA methyltransferase [Bacilli bacterium]
MEEIRSVNNSYIKYLKSLKQKKYRKEHKMFLVEGYHLVEEAAKAKVLDAVLVIDKKDQIQGVKNYLINSDIIEDLASTITPQNIIGVCSIKQKKELTSNKVLVLDELQDPGNLGTVIRTAIAFGFTDIAVSNNTVDIYNDKVIRGTQGMLFRANFMEVEIKDFLLDLKAKGYKVITTSLGEDVITPDELPKLEKSALVLGNEARGLKDEVLELADFKVTIPMADVVESLNVGVAGGIMMYLLSKQK